MNIDTLTIIQILTLIIIFVVIVLLYRQEKIFKLDNRIGKYAINPINAKNNSIYDNVRSFFYNLINKLGRNLNKSKMIKDYSKRYEKYVIYDGKTKAIDYVSNKIIMSGDHGRAEYDEVNIMKNYAIERGVKSEDIFMDHAGF